MSVDLGLRHDRSLRERAAEMFERGLGYESAARGLGVPAEAVRDWQKTYRATGRDGLLAMGGRQARYDRETKVAARAVVDGGMSKPEAMELFGIASATPLKQWCRLYRGGRRPRRRQDRAQDDGRDGLRCGIRRETDHHRHGSYRGAVGETFENVLGRDFAADGPWQKMGTDVTEFRLSFGRAHLAPVYDFGSKEIVAWSVSLHPDLAQQEEMLAMLMAAKPGGAAPVLHSDMGWQYQHASYVAKLRENGFTQNMSRKGNCIDNGATEQVFGHIKDEFFRGRDWDTFEEFKRDLEAYIHHWNHVRRQARLRGLAPVEFGSRPFGGPPSGYDLSRPSFGAQFRRPAGLLLAGRRLGWQGEARVQGC